MARAKGEPSELEMRLGVGFEVIMFRVPILSNQTGVIFLVRVVSSKGVHQDLPKIWHLDGCDTCY